MTYKQTDVFLSAEDSAKIAPYVPKEMIEGWEWWWLGNDIVNISKTPLEYTKVPALDVGILGQILDEVLSKPPFYQDPENASVTVDRVYIAVAKQAKSIFAEPGDTIWEHSEQFTGSSELQNRRDALIYLIDNGLIGEGKTNA